jgi:hypothetical protein
MAMIVQGLRSGAWVSRERMRLVALAVLAAGVIGFGWLVVTADGLNDVRGRPLGTDFANVYAAGTYVLDGQPTLPFDPPAQHAREREIFGAATPFYGWHYPPFFLFVATPLALLPYPAALAVWQGVTFALYLWVIALILSSGLFRSSTSPSSSGDKDVDARLKAGHDGGEGGSRGHLWLLLACAYPAVFINLGHGHNGFLTAALLGGALVLLDRRPWMAGVLIGLLAYKPQFGLLIPLVLLATWRWRTIVAAAATVVALVIVTTVTFGLDVWSAFEASTRFTRIVVLENGDTGWYKIQSIFSWVRMWGGSIPLAYALQTIATIVLAAALVWLWRSRVDFSVKAAGLAVAAILATPYSLDYDLMVLALAIAFLTAHGLAHGFVPYERSVLAVVWLVPLIARSFAEWTLIPLGVPVMLLLFVLIMIRTAAAVGLEPRWHFPSRALK